MEVTIGNEAQLILQAQSIRYQVFTLEQGIPAELDLDGLDNESFHVLVTDNSEPVATARLTQKEGGHSVMARVAVTESHRGLGVATKVIEALIEHARSIGLCSIEIHAHSYLRTYYEKFGFLFIQQVEVVGEHQLIEMQLGLTRG
ncbi:GNAT family N-acetyltransferase [Vibrio brasiliensis]|uniref:GNAT family N-acetyltransferase n=1 Tax=Vibrio brasiliensis TaxID=170652 RepID=UPI001EFC60DE|nr:GNAT family N-acetyltransferase [Vibrio brasiliensis]MCG9727702.1 GNAT family N-acetyltransferase [Vibrio brasiliensis]